MSAPKMSSSARARSLRTSQGSQSTQVYEGTPPETQDDTPKRALRSKRADPFEYPESPSEPVATRRRAPSDAKNQASMRAPAPAMPKSKSASPAIPATPATPTPVATPATPTSTRTKKQADIRSQPQQGPSAASRGAFAVPLDKRETRGGAKRKGPLDSPATPPLTKKIRTRTITPDRIAATPVIKRSGATSAAARSLSWQQARPLQVVSAVNFYGASDESELKQRSFMVEDGGVLMRTDYHKWLTEQNELIDDYKERIVISLRNATKSQTKLDALIQEEEEAGAPADNESEEAQDERKTRQEKIQRLKVAVQRFTAAHAKQQKVLAEQQQKLEDLKSADESVYRAPDGKPLKVHQSGPVYGLGEVHRVSNSKCLIPKIFIKRGDANNADRAQARTARRVLEEDYTGDTWLMQEANIEDVRELGHRVA